MRRYPPVAFLFEHSSATSSPITDGTLIPIAHWLSDCSPPGYPKSIKIFIYCLTRIRGPSLDPIVTSSILPGLRSLQELVTIFSFQLSRHLPPRDY